MYLRNALLYLLLSLSLYSSQSISAPLPFEREQTRLTFAQMYLGYEYDRNNITVPNVANSQTERNPFQSHNLTFGGWHFWGIADFWMTFPIKNINQKYAGNTYRFSPGIETGVRLYPMKLSNNKLRPFLGISFRTEKFSIGDGPVLQRYAYPIQFGMSIANNDFQLEAGLRLNNKNTFSYPVSKTQNKTVEHDNYNWFIGLKRVVDTTIMQSKILNLTPQENGLYPFFSLGLSSAWTARANNSFFKKHANWIDNDTNSLLIPEFAIGLHWKNTAVFNQRTIAQISYRKFGYRHRAYGSNYDLNYSSFAFEIAQSLFDYHGFVPHVGLSYNVANLKMTGGSSASETKNILGVLIGWDTLPFGAGVRWSLRSNIRWYPQVDLKVNNNESLSFPNIEFNFLQFVLQFGRTSL